jgi:TatD DNase family protein
MASPIPLFDSHCHLDYIQRQEGEVIDSEKAKGVSFEPEDVIERASSMGVNWIVNPSVTPKRFPEVLSIAERFPGVYAALAIHPTDVGDIQDEPHWVDSLLPLLSHPKVVALGETGLDYYWDTSLKDLQKHCFDTFLHLGVEHDLPVIVHDRDAHEDVAEMIHAVPNSRGIMHCFSGDKDFAFQMMDENFYISFAGNVTFKKALELQEAAKVVPLDRLLIETDSPFLSPMPHRGKPNEPARVFHVAEFIAQLRGISLEALAEATTHNALTCFGLHPDGTRTNVRKAAY